MAAHTQELGAADTDMHAGVDTHLEVDMHLVDKLDRHYEVEETVAVVAATQLQQVQLADRKLQE